MTGKFSLFIMTALLLFRIGNFCNYDLGRCYRRFKFYKVEDYGSKYKFLADIRNKVSGCYEEVLPKPVSYLVLGMVLGLDKFGEVPEFKKALKDTGTVHAVVVSGYNMNLVFSVMLRFLGSSYNFVNVGATFGFGILYALLTGFEPPVMRALLMSSALLLNKYLGRSVSIFVVLYFSAWVLLMAFPNLIFNLSFLLSFGASLSLVSFSEIVGRFFEGRVFKFLPLKEDIVSTISAQILVWPLLSIYFGTFNFVGFITNPVLLWTVPITTLGGGVLAVLCYLPEQLNFATKIFAFLIQLPAEIFARGVMWFSSFRFLNNSISLGLTTSLVYYLGVFIFFIIARKKRKK